MKEGPPSADATGTRPGRVPVQACIPEAKLAPVRGGRRRTVARTRLFESLSSAVATRRLTLLAAPPGTGKTTLLSSWIESGAAPPATAWLTLDEQDNSEPRFWQAAAAALDSAGVGDTAARGDAAPARPGAAAIGRES